MSKLKQRWYFYETLVTILDDSLLPVLWLHNNDSESSGRYFLDGLIVLRQMVRVVHMSCFFWENGQCFNQLARHRYWRHFSIALSWSLFLPCFFSLSSALQVDVTVDLRPEELEIPLHRDIVLLLRCDKSVNWVIKAHSIIGKLHIVVRRHVYAQLYPKSFPQMYLISQNMFGFWDSLG